MGNIQDWQHSAMYAAFLLAGLVDLLGHWMPEGTLPEGTEYVSWSSSLKNFSICAQTSCMCCGMPFPEHEHKNHIEESQGISIAVALMSSFVQLQTVPCVAPMCAGKSTLRNHYLDFIAGQLSCRR